MKLDWLPLFYSAFFPAIGFILFFIQRKHNWNDLNDLAKMVRSDIIEVVNTQSRIGNNGKVLISGDIPIDDDINDHITFTWNIKSKI